MDRIWAPWRMKYISHLEDPVDEGCIFCTKPEQDTDKKNLLIVRRKFCFALMNLYPYNNSHILVVPYRHLSSFEDLDSEELLECQETIQDAIGVMRKSMSPHGFNIGMNLGKAGGAGIEQHLHWHLVPRWIGDANFMPIIGDTKVVSESIEESWKRMADGFSQLRSGS
jgi:ATP adenylyltransferase